jgi:phytoene synthase
MATPITELRVDWAAVAESRKASRLITRRHARSLYFASAALPKEKRDAAFAVYAFCRHADDLAERPLSSSVPELMLARLHEDLEAIFRGKSVPLRFAPALSWAIRRFELPHKLFIEWIEGTSRDGGDVRIADWPALRRHCFHAASVVSLIMARIFEMKTPAAESQAVELGIAIRLTNILRHIPEDYANGRIYLPSTELAEFRVTEADLARGHVTPFFAELMQFQITRARGFYRSAESGIPMLANDGSQLSVWLIREIHGGILDQIERNHYDVFHGRPVTTFPGKVRLGWQAWRQHRRSLR